MGIFLDENLSWKSHITYICKTISKSAGIIFRSRFYLSTKTKLLLYYSLVHPYLTYCNLTWSSTYVTNLNRIFLIQKRIVRAITNAPYHAHSAPRFAQLKLLDIYKLTLSIPPNLCFLVSTVYSLLLFFISSPEIMIFIITIPEQLLIIAHKHVFAERILSNLPFSSKVLKSGTLCLLLSLVQSLFCPLGKKCLPFLLINTINFHQNRIHKLLQFSSAILLVLSLSVPGRTHVKALWFLVTSQPNIYFAFIFSLV